MFPLRSAGLGCGELRAASGALAVPAGRPRFAATVPGRLSWLSAGSEPGLAAGAGPAPPSLPPALPPSLPARWPPDSPGAAACPPHAYPATAAPSRLPRARPGRSRRRPRRDGRWLVGWLDGWMDGGTGAGAGGAAPGRVRTAPSGGRWCSACTPARAPAGGGGAPGRGRHVTLERRRGGEGRRRACAWRWRGSGGRGPGSTYRNPELPAGNPPGPSGAGTSRGAPAGAAVYGCGLSRGSGLAPRDSGAERTRRLHGVCHFIRLSVHPASESFRPTHRRRENIFYLYTSVYIHTYIYYISVVQ